MTKGSVDSAGNLARALSLDDTVGIGGMHQRTDQCGREVTLQSAINCITPALTFVAVQCAPAEQCVFRLCVCAFNPR